MPQIGEQIVGAYLQAIEECELVEYNVPLPDAAGKGEIDVVAVNLSKKKVFICEVTTHTQGLGYTRKGKMANVQVLKNKFEKDIVYGRKKFKGFKQEYMFWSPVVKYAGVRSKFNAIKDLEEVHDYFSKKHKVDIKMICNKDYLDRFNKLKGYAEETSARSDNPVIRVIQIQAKLQEYCDLLDRKNK